MAHRLAKAGIALALLAPASTGMASTAEDEALANELLVCNGKFIALMMYVTGHDHADQVAKASYTAWWEAKTLAGTDFAERQKEDVARQVLDWLGAKDDSKPKPTLDAAMKTCIPVMKHALDVINARGADAAHPD